MSEVNIYAPDDSQFIGREGRFEKRTGEREIGGLGDIEERWIPCQRGVGGRGRLASDGTGRGVTWRVAGVIAQFKSRP